MCQQCGLPDELCVCEDMNQSEDPTVRIWTEDAGFADKVHTLLENTTLSEERTEELESELKSDLACGGTSEPSKGIIKLQGDHTGRDKLVTILEKYDYEPVFL